MRTSKKSVGLLLMDQGFWAGVGNIYRAEILFVARVHPSVPGVQLTRDEFDRIWSTSVSLMRRGYEQGSILTVDPAEATALGRPSLRRWIYNSATCGRPDPTPNPKSNPNPTVAVTLTLTLTRTRTRTRTLIRTLTCTA